MKTVKVLLFLTTFFVPLFSQIESATINNNLRDSVKDASLEDTRFFLNLVYWSYQRSQTTILAQDAALQQLTASWKLWQNCAQTRINPTRALPYPAIVEVSSMTFNKAAQAQFHAHAAYAHITEQVLKQSLIKNKKMNAYIVAMREQARQKAAQAVLDSLAAFYDSMQHTQQDLIQCAQSFHPTKSIITDGVNYLLSGFGLPSFSTLDKQYNKKSDQLMSSILKSQELFNQVWFHIETARANFYKQIYTELVTLIHELNLPITIPAIIV
jgi:hypothetical protein